MHAWEQIQKAIDQIEEGLYEEVKIETLANTAALSQFYFQRLFKRLVQKTVNEYVKLRRLARASEVLGEKGKRVVDIALDHGFSCHETFTRGFKETYGMTPEEYRANPVPLNHFQKPELLLNYVLVDEGVPLIANSIVLEVTRKKLSTPEIYLGMSGQVPIAQAAVGKATGPDEAAQLWHSFHQHKAEIPDLEPGGVELGASMLGNTESGTFTYFVGGEAKPQASARGELVKWELPPGEYVVCKFEAESFTDLTSSALGKAMDYLFGTWLPKNSLTSQPFLAEKYLPLTQEFAAMEIWVIPEPLEAASGDQK